MNRGQCLGTPQKIMALVGFQVDILRPRLFYRLFAISLPKFSGMTAAHPLDLHVFYGYPLRDAQKQTTLTYLFGP
ncbi:MAG: hypothetical protein BECKG1743E_GA0114224_111752 [Candidatus Kentron sp. G]|nr:MAG: hypothetical protein BECKG1743E_GA0114224_111752 [Candidatus Kentron sp. G]